jgi:hypothetical protein
MGWMIKIMSDQEPIEGYFMAKEEMNNSQGDLDGGNEDVTLSMMLDSTCINFDMRKAMTDINTSMLQIQDHLTFFL